MNIATAIRVRNAKRMNDQEELQSIKGNLDRTRDTRINASLVGTALVLIILVLANVPGFLFIAGGYLFTQLALHIYARLTVENALLSNK